MILRRLATAFRKQDWFTVAVETLIVVLGVFLGLQLGNWNEARHIDSQRELVEARLLSDFALMHEDVLAAADNHEDVIEALHILRGAIARGRALPEEDQAIKTALSIGFSYQSPIHRSGTFLELVSSGRLDLISEEELRVALLRYDTRAQRVLFNLNQIRNYMHTNMPNLHAYKEFAPLARDDRGRITLSPVETYDLEGMASDPEFRNALDLLIENQTWIQLNISGQEAALEDVLQVLQENTS
ncbi:MAG: hypothetical protein WA989_13730 [Henriciella sp.]|uniref:hypothetical protein n=1 Tax=Henriciella sp. TaxID=1968823 RepID=UPI003C70BB0B